ncbi:MAG: hypothetical protein M1522_09790, partial [Actinobacteria bacterium]|nr:hypothetical protein [Actinomycetota bacterium]
PPMLGCRRKLLGNGVNHARWQVAGRIDWAFRMQPGAESPDLDSLRGQLAAAGLAKQKWPEEIRSVDDFPRTPSGKVKKYTLREQLRSEGRA